MKCPFAFLFLALLILSACAPVAAPTSAPATNVALLPTDTPAPTATFTATPLPTATPTATPTPTPIPTLSPESVGGLEGIPDPKISNPELFDLKNTDAPIPQFVNAMKRAGIEVKGEEVLQNLTYVSTKNDGTPLVDQNGNPFVVAAYHLDPDPNQKDETLEGPIPLMIWDKEEGWKMSRLKTIFNIVGKDVGVYLSIQIKHAKSLINDEFNLGEVSFVWKDTQNTRNGPIDTDWINSQFAAFKKGKIRMSALLFPQTYPKWLNNSNLTKEDLERAMENYINQVVGKYKNQVDQWIVVNEAYFLPYRPDILAEKIGFEEYIIRAFQTVQKLDPDATLIYNDGFNHTPNGLLTSYSQRIIEILQKNGVYNLGIGLQMHLDGKTSLNEEDLIKAMKSYGVPVFITELDINMRNVNGTPEERARKQAEMYKIVIQAALKSGVCYSITFFGIGDKYSWIETEKWYQGYSPNADPTLFHDNLSPKLAYYAVQQAVFNWLISNTLEMLPH